MSERRESSRIEHRMLAYIREKDDYCVTRNLSPKGCLVQTTDPLPEGSEVNLDFTLPGGQILSVQGRVKHTGNGDCMGVEFTSLGMFRKAYMSFLNALSSIQEGKAFFDAIKEENRPASEKRRAGFRAMGKKVASGLDTLKTVFWILFLASFLFTGLKHQHLENERTNAISALEKARGTKVITMVHREETVGFFGIPVKRYIKEEDAEAILRAIREVPNDMPIDLVLHTPGGILLPAFQIAKALKDHKGKVTVFVPHYAMSGGTLIALAADEIVMDKNAVLGPVDPQFMMKGGATAAVSVLSIPKHKSWDKMDDETIILIDQAKKSVQQVKEMVRYLLTCQTPKSCKRLDIEKVVSRLVGGQVTHDYPVFVNEARNLGLPVSTDMPDLVYRMMELYPQPSHTSVSSR